MMLERYRTNFSNLWANPGNSTPATLVNPKVTGKLTSVSDETFLQNFRTQVDARINQLLPDESLLPADLHRAMRYSALAPGKRLRPIMAMTSAQACGSNPQIALDAGCAIELIHCFSLIHDDLPAIDNDDLRRGRPTCHKVFGEGLAILAGDALFALAFEILATSSPHPAKSVHVMTSVAQASGSQGLVGGEVLDIQSEGISGDIDLLQTIHNRKTGALLSASCEVGAILAGAPPQVQTDLRMFGQKVGLAFQVADDVLNETSSAEKLGKAVGTDSELNKLTYPKLLGLEQSQELANQTIEEALALIAPLGPSAEPLADLARYAIQRNW